MSDDSFHILPKKFRKRRKRTGEEIDAALLSAVLGRQADAGVICKECGRRRHWRDIYFTYKGFKGQITRSWFCRVCDNMIKEDEL